MISAASASGTAPPNIPEWTGLSSVSTVTTTLPVPRRLVVTVGVPSSTLPASAISMTSAANRDGSERTSCANPPVDISSDPSHTTRIPTGHGVGRARRAVRSMTRLPLQSAAPRAYQRPSRSVSSHGGECHSSGSPAGWTS
jgi:hypothetical protein